PPRGFKYWAFISYSHGDKKRGLWRDKTWGDWVINKLETYRTPLMLVGKTGREGPVPRRLFPIFRDREELPGAANLGDNINEALRNSLYLIVICSPRAAASRWVNEEVRYFKSLGREGKLLCLIVDGEPNAGDRPDSGQLECFPPAVRFHVEPDGQLTTQRTEPIAADARPQGDGLANAKLKMVAGLLGVDYDALRQRDRRRRRLRQFQWGILITVAIGLGLNWWLEPGIVELNFRPPSLPSGLQVRIDDRSHDIASNRPLITLPAGRHNFQIEAPDHESLSFMLDLDRRQKIDKLVELHHYQGILSAESTPAGSTIEINELRYGSPIPNLPLDTGAYNLQAWAGGCFEVQRQIKISRGQKTKADFWLEKGVQWLYSSPAIQSGLAILPDFKVKGKPVIAHNELDRIIFISTDDGSVITTIRTPAGNTRTFNQIDLGGNIGQVIVSGFDAETNGPNLMVIKAVNSPKVLWSWSGPVTDFERSDSLAIVALPNPEGVADLAVAGRDGHIYILDGQTGRQRGEIVFSNTPVRHPPSMTPWTNAGRTYLAGFSNPGDPSTLTAGPTDLVAAMVDLKNNKLLWQKNLGQGQNGIWAMLKKEGPLQLIQWDNQKWQLLDGATGTPHSGGSLPGSVFSGPLLMDMERNDQLNLVFQFTDPELPMRAVNSGDGSMIWQGPSQTSTRYQARGPNNSNLRAPNGELIVLLNNALAALDPRTGKVAWKVEGNPRGVMVGDWLGDGKGQIFVTMLNRGLLCVDGSGRILWTLRMDQDVEPWALLPPSYGVGRRDILIHRHAASIGLVHGPRFLWQANASGPLQATPVVATGDDGRPLLVELGPWGNDISLRGLNADTGSVRWSAQEQLTVNRGVALADIDGNGRPLIVAIGSKPPQPGTRLLVYRPSDGQLLRSPQVAVEGWLSCTPAVADFRGIGKSDVVFSTWDDRSIVLIDGQSGAVVWKQRTDGPNMGGVTAADLDGDGLSDVVATSFDGHVYANRGKDGKLLWKAPIQGGAWSTPTVTDLDGDRAPQVLVVSAVGRLYVLDGRTGQLRWSPDLTGGMKVAGRPVVIREKGQTIILAPLGSVGVVAFDWTGRREMWRSPEGFPVIASPVITNLAGNEKKQVVIGATTGDAWVLNLTDGKPQWHMKVGANLVEADPVVADLDGDHIPDLLITDHDFHLYAISGRTIGIY
ncbi:MAG: PQQ-binding-like beta-propeller repeat protein, partial [Deltaproteobacteria bacterium]|nr:PQQ-binding-like beta-propeller repeat protein [Deltaproteobacteria bacterium]